MQKWMRFTMLGVALMTLLGTTACKKIVLRDTVGYKNEVYLLEMSIQQSNELLVQHINDGSCSCDEDGVWNNEVCETSALNVLVMAERLDWHVAMMMFMGGVSEDDPGEIPPVSEDDVAKLCPSDG